MILGLTIALAGALAVNVAFLLEQRGAARAPAVNFARPIKSAMALFRSRWFAIGLGVAAVAWCLHVAAMALAPLSVVQCVFAGGLVFLALLAERFFGFQLGKRQWAGLIVTSAGLAMIALTSGFNGDDNGRYALTALVGLEVGVFGVAIALIVALRNGHPALSARPGIVLAASAGMLYGVADVAIKYLTDAVESGVLGLVSVWTVAAVLASIAAFYTSARAMQIGPGVDVIAITSVAANLTAIIGGVLVFQETIGADTLAVAGRVLAFTLVLVGAALVPAPVRAMTAVRPSAPAAPAGGQWLPPRQPAPSATPTTSFATGGRANGRPERVTTSTTG